ncbi:MAG TPA: hypothetical protein ENG70_01035 [Candidatus Cloacimonetes bacterium]|nr:hypothetical protein [Candidatus Cloacimonadota bacterium]HEX37439.1 hypothetical protein [Candidatus Cloacimonadota bacterium]
MLHFYHLRHLSSHQDQTYNPHRCQCIHSQ